MDSQRPSSSHSGHMHYFCNGTVAPMGGGTWKGHVYPGAVFILWGAWWAACTLLYFLWRSGARPYRGRPWYPFPAPGLRFLEPALKIAVPAVAVTLELWADHHFHFQHLYCPPGTKFAGRFEMTNLNNWQHALSYPGFVLSGLVDIAGHFVPLPAGTSQAVLGSAFGASAFIMWTHEKHEPQDKMVHWLLAVAMFLSTLAVFGEMAARRNVLAGAGKSLALLLQGAWLVQLARIEFEGRVQWSPEYSGGAMFAPTVFALIFFVVLASLLAAYVLLALVCRAGWLRGLEALPPEEEEDGEEESREEQRFGRLHRHHRYDSANHSDECEEDGQHRLELEGGPLKLHGMGGGRGAAAAGGNGSGVAPFQIAGGAGRRGEDDFV